MFSTWIEHLCSGICMWVSVVKVHWTYLLSNQCNCAARVTHFFFIYCASVIACVNEVMFFDTVWLFVGLTVAGISCRTCGGIFAKVLQVVGVCTNTRVMWRWIEITDQQCCWLALLDSPYAEDRRTRNSQQKLARETCIKLLMQVVRETCI